jgi:myosin heavy subunit
MAILNIFLLSPRFGLFKKKDNTSEIKNPDNKNQLHATDTLTMSEALSLLQHIESEKVKILSNNLSSIKDSVMRSLGIVQKVADDMERDKIKLEELRFESIVENSKRTVIASLRREASSDLPLPQSTQDAKKFNDRLESMMNRFGEVTGSHSKVMNIFMKKYVGKLKGEFDTLSSLLKTTKSIMKEFEEEIADITKCVNLLNMISQKAASIKTDEGEIERTNKEIEMLRGQIHELKNRSASLENSTQFKESIHNIEEIDIIEQEKKEFSKQMLDLFSHVSRAFTKYSYGTTKATSDRLKVLVDEPWKIFESDISSYTSLLIEIRKAINSDKIKLKDSEKISHYFDTILKSLPEWQDKTKTMRSRLNVLYGREAGKIVDKSKELRGNIEDHDKQIEDLEQSLDQLRIQLTEKSNEIGPLIKRTEDHLFKITQKKYFLVI